MRAPQPPRPDDCGALPRSRMWRRPPGDPWPGRVPASPALARQHPLAHGSLLLVAAT